MPSLRQLSYLVMVADTGSFVKAAQNCHVSQPTLSQQIKALEERLGAKLLERSAQGAALTPVGRSVVGKAREVLAQVREIETMTQRWSSSLSGTIKLGTTPTLGPYLLSPMFAELHKIAPELHFYVREGIPQEQAQQLSRGELDLHLGPLPVSGSDLHVEPLFREPLHLVAAADDPLSTRALVQPEALQGRWLLSLDQRHHFHRQCAEIASAYGMRLSSDYEGTSLDTLHQMVASGLALAVLPNLYLASEVGGMSGLAIVPVAGWQPYRSIALAWRRGSVLTPTFALLGEHVQRSARIILARQEVPLPERP
jgi:LysR family transcriptional regulator, hydrogen peroxide-inducible genes activator